MSELLGSTGQFTADPSDADRWAHQPIAVAAIEMELGDGGRATAEAACGAGKSRIAAQATGRLARTGRVLVTVPTLELVGQMLETLAAHGGPLGQIVAVCSDTEVVSVGDVDLGDAAVTTEPEALAAATDVPGRVTVLCTYQSLQVLAVAHARCGMPAWDMAVIDEAHRTAGRAGKSWSLIHDDVVIPATRRLYMTATRKIMSTNGDDPAVSMDDEKIYGPVVFRFTTRDGIDRGLLADYQVLVVMVTDRQIRELAEEEDRQLQVGGIAVSPRMLATQIAVLRAAQDYGLRRAITFHNRVADAEKWAAVLPHAWQLMPAGERPPGVAARHIQGSQRISGRRQALKLLASAGTGARTGPLHVVCNARVLTEGVDAPAVDGVVFIDPRNSVIDTVQAVGRALRTGGQPDKIARIIVPVVLGPDEDPESALNGSAYAQVYQVVRALRAHDDRLADYLDTARARIGARRTTDEPGAVDLEPDANGIDTHWLEVCGAPVPPGFASAIQIRAVQAASSAWTEHYGAAKAYFDEYGHLDVRRGYETPDGLQLGIWLRRQADDRRAMAPERKQLLDAIGMIWNRKDAKWHRDLAAIRKYVAEHGPLHKIPPNCTSDGVRVKQWVMFQRSQARAGNMTEERLKAIADIDPTWLQTDFWERLFQAAADFSARNGHLRPGKGEVTVHGTDLHGWLKDQRMPVNTALLTAERKERLDGIGMVWSLHEDDWRRGLAAAAAYAREHGNLDVSSSFVAKDGFPLGQWIGDRRTRARKGTLSADHKAALDRLDREWDTARSTQARWQAHFDAARAYADRHGRLPRHSSDAAPEGLDFRKWLRVQRQSAKEGRLRPERRSALDSLDPKWLGTVGMAGSARDRAWEIGYAAASVYQQEHRHLDVPSACITDDGYRLGKWIIAQRALYNKGKLSPDRSRRLESLGIQWSLGEVRRNVLWEHAMAAATAFHQEYGHLNVPRHYTTNDGLKLGTWITRQREKCEDENRRRQLDGLGMIWSLRQAEFEEGFAHAAAYAREHGHLHPPPAYRTDDNFSLGRWLADRRRGHTRLTSEQRTQLDALDKTWADNSKA